MSTARFWMIAAFLATVWANADAQYVPRSVVYFNNGSILYGDIASSDEDSHLLRLENGKQLRVPQLYVRGVRRITPPLRVQIEDGLLSPTTAGLLSLLFNGAGEYYAGNSLEGTVQLFMQIGLLAMYLRGVNSVPGNESLVTYSVVFWLALKLVSIISAVGTAQDVNAHRINAALFDSEGLRFGALNIGLGQSTGPYGAAAGLQLRF